MTGDYDVGYKKPPKSGQFKKGKSGNPKGRKKGERGFGTIVKEVLKEPVSVKEGGRERVMSRLEALIKKTVADAIQGDSKARVQAIKFAEQYLPHDEPDEVAPFAITERTRQAMEFFENLDDADLESEALDIAEDGSIVSVDPAPAGVLEDDWDEYLVPQSSNPKFER